MRFPYHGCLAEDRVDTELSLFAEVRQSRHGIKVHRAIVEFEVMSAGGVTLNPGREGRRPYSLGSLE
jgi:hypothetical protein